MRLLLQRHDHGRKGFVGPQSRSRRGRNQERPGGPALSVRRPQSGGACGSPCGSGAREMTDKGLSRRRFTQSLGIVVASFALAPRAAFEQTPGTLPFSLRNNRRLEGWIRLEPDETVTVFTGKAELGQGILTALAQIAAEELDVGFEKIRMVGADTSRGPDEQYTFGSQSVEQSGSAIRAASAQARGILLAAAARRFGARPEDLDAKAGIIASPDGKRATFWEVASADPDLLKGDITATAAPKKPSDYSIVGK